MSGWIYGMYGIKDTELILRKAGQPYIKHCTTNAVYRMIYRMTRPCEQLRVDRMINHMFA